jgi:hypothetical protein
MKGFLLTVSGAALLGALSFGAASAEQSTAVVPSATVGVDYSYIDANHGLGHVNDYGVNGSGILPLGSNFVVQGDAGYHNLQASGTSVNNWTVGGSVAYTHALGRIGATVAYNAFDVSGANLNVTNYGAFGEWYVNDRATLGVKGGGATLSGSFGGFGLGNTTVGYAGGEALGYLTPDLSVSGSVDWAGKNGVNVTSGGVQGEYLISHQYPVSVFGGYTYTDLSGFGGGEQANTFSIGVKYYFGGNGSLVEHQRTGIDNWGPAVTALRTLF